MYRRDATRGESLTHGAAAGNIACGSKAARYAPKLVSRRVFALLALTALVACNTYNDSLLAGPLGSGLAAGDSGTSGGAGEANAAGSRNHAGSGNHTGNGEAGADSEDGTSGSAGSGLAGAPAAEAGKSGSDGQAGSVANAGSPGTGGSSGLAGGDGSAGALAFAGAPSGPEIDDFEDLDKFLLHLSQRNGPWYVFSDATTTGTLGPLTIAPLSGADVRPSGSSTAALHLTATGFSGWGAGVGADMVNNQLGKKVPYDVSAYSAIRFYAKIGSGASAAVKVLLPNVYSDADGGKCSDSVTTKHCGDHLFKSVVGLKTAWNVYEVKFSELIQQGFGLAQTGFDPKGVYSVQFTLANTLPVDLWLDDVTFVLK